jgi:hypothetical protein
MTEIRIVTDTGEALETIKIKTVPPQFILYRGHLLEKSDKLLVRLL